MNVPRDMSIWAARRLREALEVTAAIAGGTAQLRAGGRAELTCFFGLLWRWPRQGRDSWRARSTRRSNSRKCSGDLNAPPPTPAMPAAWTGAPSANPMAGSVACKGRVRGADNKDTAELQRELLR